MADLRIIVVGGGIAGLVAALALRAPRREVIVLEASRMNKELGALISLQPNASKIATSLGLDSILASTGPMEDKAFRVYNPEGQKQMDIPSDFQKYGAQRIIYHRVDLHNALKEACTAPHGYGKPVQIIPSSRVLTADCEKGIVNLESGTTYQGDIIIGADGIHSNLRTSVLGQGVSAPKPTGLSAYRLLLDTADLERSKAFTSVINPREAATIMVVGHDRRIVMGPGRDGSVYGVVAIVPDEHMKEDSDMKSWTSEGDTTKLFESFAEFPEWIKDVLRASNTAPALYQLRDIDPLPNWVRGRTILIGDAAHAMLPTQGQGASQSFEDAEALQAFLRDVNKDTSEAEIKHCLREVYETRHARASLIQAYSRQQAKPGMDPATMKVKLNPVEFLDYNCKYDGAKAWRQKMNKQNVVEGVVSHTTVPLKVVEPLS
ncbi:hypothetical protein BP5796_03546 [Coleophoma crateriformis]|uniref:FAD-binding domain-containing protein n=1 Tax=Coleophoma crateriformis TaxID=565419 RepID=A0A3D8SNJ4_9HELO|nr:hypothetical protein BP5796_03546 [Coleophoma crateriformis]